MKTTKAIVVWFFTFMVVYFVLSALGCLFFSADGKALHYSQCAGSASWFVMYSLFIGWWLSSIVAMDYYDHG